MARQKQPTIQEVSRRSGVSVATVSRVLHGESGRFSPDTEKKVREAMAELKNAEAPRESEGWPLPGGKERSGEVFVADCTLESDLQMYFPDQYVPNDSERMLLYRELDSVRNDQELDAYRNRLKDRFGPIPHVAEELLQVVPLRRYGKQLGCEQIMLKQGRMFLFFVSNPLSPFYQSEAFGHILDFVGNNPHRCNFRDAKGKRSLVINDVPSVEEAVKLLSKI